MSGRARHLDERYFTTIQTEKQGNIEYQVVRPKDHPMVLFSKKDGSPLVALHFRTQNNHVQNDARGNRGRALISKRPYNSAFKCDFQGLVDRDDQEFEIVISNLNQSGHINFNILKTDTKVETVNPGGLNEINELRPGESYAVQCDQTDNKVLVIKTIKKEGGGHVTVAEDEAKEGKPTGAYFFLSVVPELANQELVERFKETEWACVDLFCRQVTVPQNLYPSGRNCWLPGYGLEAGGPEGVQGPTGWCGTGALENAQCAMMPANLTRCVNSAGGTVEKSLTFDYHTNIPDHILRNVSEKIEAIEVEENLELEGGDIHWNEDWFEDSDEEELQSFSSKSTHVPSAKMAKKESKTQTQDVIQDSLASRVTGGDRTVHVSSHETNIEYSYDTPSVPCVLGLSVSDKLVFGPEPCQQYLLELAKEILADYMQAGAKTFLEKLSKVYKSDTCGLCLEGVEEENPVDCIFYQCGHQCCHYECCEPLNSCPMCRTYITAKIRV